MAQKNPYRNYENRGYFDYFADNEIESSWDVANAHTMQIQNKLLTTLYRGADATIGWALPDEQRKKFQEEIEMMRENYIETENAINGYINNYANPVEAVALSAGGMLYRGIVDPVNLVANVATGGMSTGAMLLSNFLIDLAQYTSDTSFYEKRNVFTDPKLEDALNIGISTAMSVGSAKIQAKYRPTNTPLYNESGELFVKNFPKNTDELTEMELKNKNMPPLDKMANTNNSNPELLNSMQERGYDSLIDTKSFSQVAQRQLYGQPQGNYNIEGTKNSIHNMVDNVIDFNRKYQEELYKHNSIRRSSLSMEDEVTYAVKPLKTEIENAQEYYYGEYARQFSEATGYNGAMGDMIWNASLELDKNVLVDGLMYGRAFSTDGKDFKLYNLLRNQLDDYATDLKIDNGYKKAMYYEKLYSKNEHQANVIRAIKNNDIDYIKNNIAPFCGEKVELTKAEAEAVGLVFDPKKANKTLEKGQGGYVDFEVEFKDLKNKVKDYVKKEKEVNLKNQQKEIEDIREIYKKKADDIRRGRTSIQTEREILKGEVEEIRANRNSILETESKKFNVERDKINTSYKNEVKNINLERDSKIKEVKAKISEIRKQETAEINKIQNDSKLYDPDKLPMAKRVQKKNAKEIRKLKDEIFKISKEYEKKVSEIDKKRNSDIEIINKQESDLRNSFKKGTKEYLKTSKKNKEKFVRKSKADVNRELKKLQDELDRQEATINRKYRGKDYNKFSILNSKVKKINQSNYKNIYKKLKSYEKDFSEIKTLGELADSDGRYVQTNTYSINDNPLEVSQAFVNDMVRTNRESLKKLTGIDDVIEAKDYREIKFVGEKWGNKSRNIVVAGEKNQVDLDPMDNFIKSAMGTEKETYDIIANLFSDNVEQKSGLNEAKKFYHNLVIDDEKFSNDLTLDQQEGIRGLTPETRKYSMEALNSLIRENSAKKRIAPNLFIDPKEQRIQSGMLRRTFKALASVKFLANLRAFGEIPQNNFRVQLGAQKLGWDRKYQYLKDYTEGIKVCYQIAKNYKKLKNNTLEGITDPIIKRRLEIYLDRKLSNSLTFNETGDVVYKMAGRAEKFIEGSGNKGAILQTVSDIERITTAEMGAIDYMLDILPTAKSKLLDKILKTNGIGEADFNIINKRIAELGDEGLMDLVWSGKKATNFADYKIQSLFEQFSDVLGKEFDAYKKHNSGIFGGKENFLTDTLFLFKRYSLGAVEGFTKNLTTYIDNDGMIRKTFYSMDDFKLAYKDMLKGFNGNTILPFMAMSISSKFIYDIAVKKIQGELFGSTEDELAETKFKSLMSIDGLANFTFESVQDSILNISGIGIAVGGKSVLGSMYEMAIARAKRAYSTEDLNFAEATMLWGFCLASPEMISRGIDHIKFEKNIPNRLTTFSKTEKEIWKFKGKIDAEIEQLEGKFPIQKAIDWFKYWKDNPNEAREFTNTPKELPDEIAVIGATGICGMMEETADTAAISELMTEEKEIREKRLKALGLDIDSLLDKMTLEEAREFNGLVSFKGIRDEQEILILAYHYARAKNKEQFIDDVLLDEEQEIYEIHKNNLKVMKNRINKAINTELNGIDGYLDMLDTINLFI